MFIEGKVYRWGVLWRSKNKLDGVTEHLIYKDCLPALFRTRREAEQFIDKEHNYIRDRHDLRREPHGWKTPIPVRVSIERVSKGKK